jgi:hypothetical protein
MGMICPKMKRGHDSQKPDPLGESIIGPYLIYINIHLTESIKSNIKKHTSQMFSQSLNMTLEYLG